jgi:hypothetical protein
MILDRLNNHGIIKQEYKLDCAKKKHEHFSLYGDELFDKGIKCGKVQSEGVGCALVNSAGERVCVAGAWD